MLLEKSVLCHAFLESSAPMRTDIDLGLAVAHANLARRGVRRSHKEIAAFCGCSWQAIWLIERKALQRLGRISRQNLPRDNPCVTW